MRTVGLGAQMVLVGLAAGGMPVAAAAQASPTPATITVATKAPRLVDAQGGVKAVVDVTNLTANDKVPIKVVTPQPAASGTCTVTSDQTELDPATTTPVTVTFSAGCEVPETGVSFSLQTTDAVAQTVPIKAVPKPSTGPEWIWVWLGFPLAVAASLALLFVAYLVGDEKGLTAELPGIPKTWSLDDSWISTTTATTTALAGIFGTSSTVEAIIGADADDRLALALVGAATAGALVALAALLLGLARTKDSYFTAGGVLLSGAVTLGAALGGAAVLAKTAADLGVATWLTITVGAIGGALLASYAFRGLILTIRAGQHSPPVGLVLGENAPGRSALL